MHLSLRFEEEFVVMKPRNTCERQEPARILMLAPRILDIPPNRADAVRLTNYASGLAGLGHEVYCLIFGSQASAQIYKGARYITVPGGVSFYLSSQVGNIRSVVSGAVNFLEFTVMALRLCREERIDIIHAHWLEGGLVALLLRLLSKRPLVFDPHDWFVYEYVKMLPRTPWHKVLGISFKILECVLPKLSDGTIVVNENMAKHISSKNLLVLPNCLDLVKLQTRKTRKTSIESTRQSSQRTISFVGHIAIHEGIEVILQAIPRVVAMHPEAYFKFAGCGEYEEQAKIFVKDTGIEKYVEFLGQLSHEDALDLITHSDICLAPLIETKFTSFLGVTPQKIVEYMSLGKYIVASEVPMIPAITENYPYKRLVKPGDVDELVSGIMAAIKDVSMKTECKTLDLLWYNCSFQARRLKVFYETLLSSSKKRLAVPA